MCCMNLNYKPTKNLNLKKNLFKISIYTNIHIIELGYLMKNKQYIVHQYIFN